MPEKAPKRLRIPWLAIVIVTVLSLPVLLLWIGGMIVSRIPLPEEALRAPIAAPPPPGLVRTLTAQAEPSTIPSTPAQSTPSIPPPPPPPSARPAPSPAASIWMEIIHENRQYIGNYTFELDAQYYQALRTNQSDWGPVSTEMARWLVEQGHLVEQLLRLSQAGPLKISQDAYRVATDDRERLMFQNVAPIIPCFLKILAQHARWRAQEHDATGAGRALLAALRLSGMFEARDSLYDPKPYLLELCPFIHDACRNPAWPAAQLRPLAAELERLDTELFPPGEITRQLTLQYLNLRAGIVREMQAGKWNSEVYGWDFQNRPQVYLKTISLSETRNWSLELPRVHWIGMAAMRAMRNKANAAGALRGFDKLWLELIECSRKPAPDLLASCERFEKQPLNTGNFLIGSFSCQMTYRDVALKFPREFLASEATVHLARLGLLWRLDPEATLKMRGEDLRGNPHHPWLDPLTGKSFQLDRPTSPTMIFSPLPGDPRNPSEVLIILPKTNITD